MGDYVEFAQAQTYQCLLEQVIEVRRQHQIAVTAGDDAGQVVVRKRRHLPGDQLAKEALSLMIGRKRSQKGLAVFALGILEPAKLLKQTFARFGGDVASQLFD